MNVEVKKLYVRFDRYIDILHCTLRVYTVICTKCVERGKLYLYKQVQEDKRNGTKLILQKWDDVYAP